MAAAAAGHVLAGQPTVSIRGRRATTSPTTLKLKLSPTQPPEWSGKQLTQLLRTVTNIPLTEE